MTISLINQERKIIAHMTFKIIISTNTYRTPEQQEAVFRKLPELMDAPRYTPDDYPVLFRPSQRNTSDTLIAVSVGCFAKTEDAFRELISNCRTKKTCLESIEEGFQWRPAQSTSGAVKAWKEARSRGSAVNGGRISAEKKEAASKQACEMIEGRWPQPSQVWPTSDLLKEAGISYNTAIKFLGKRPIAQYNYQAAQKRKERRNAKRVD